MKIERLRELLDDDGRISFMGHCHDCKSECTVSARAITDTPIYGDFKDHSDEVKHSIEIEGGAVYEFDERRFLKCDACFGKNRTLTDYQDCEVYARVVGYLRPVKQFNEAKQAEFKDRLNFKLGE
jgi:hypothetical protein